MNDKGKHFFKDSPIITPDEYKYSEKKGEKPKSTNNFPQEFFDIITACLCDDDLDDYYISFNGKTLYISGLKDHITCEFEIRLRCNRLTVTVVEFIEKGNGNWTRLCALLRKIQNEYNLDKILIQSCCNDEFANSLVKNGFHKIDEYGNYEDK